MSSSGYEYSSTIQMWPELFDIFLTNYFLLSALFFFTKKGTREAKTEVLIMASVIVLSS